MSTDSLQACSFSTLSYNVNLPVSNKNSKGTVWSNIKPFSRVYHVCNKPYQQKFVFNINWQLHTIKNPLNYMIFNKTNKKQVYREKMCSLCNVVQDYAVQYCNVLHSTVLYIILYIYLQYGTVHNIAQYSTVLTIRKIMTKVRGQLVKLRIH